MTNLASKIKTTSDDEFLKAYFQKCPEQQRNIVLIIDEIYVKPQLTYQGCNIFGKAINSPDQHATTILAFMFCSLFGGKKKLFKVVLVYRLDPSFQYNQSVNILKIVQQNERCIKAILFDNNKVNQKFFNMFDLEKPWKTVNNVYLLFDHVHLMKSIHNNWISEKLQELSYDNGQTAKWEHIKTLYEKEKNAVVKLSKLTKTAVSSKPIECQNVLLCLKVFCNKTL